ncbi:type II toxin-antitoxin system VapC family toxin [Dyadobacter sp. CY326]|uniref:type II toxin-antitoxin system VapC family toxin n=1 Tax=Dyadobacter sp. CY326 TaxID=2907300 RepID=UPI0038D4B036
MRRYLIDTQVLIWSLVSPARLSAEVFNLMSSNIICVSQISLLEIAIKQKLSKLPELQISVDELETIILKDGFKLIPLFTAHIAHYKTIPLFENHRDPIDRILLATAYSENTPIISSDKNFKLYSDVISLVEA